MASVPAGKSPLLAALLSLPFPGFGHVYAGAGWRGLGVFAGVMFAAALLGGTPRWFGGPVTLALLGLAAWDAWRCAERGNETARAELASGAPPRPWVRWTWAAGRLLWIAPIGLAGALILFAELASLRNPKLLVTLQFSGYAALFLGIAFLGGRSTWRVLAGSEPLAESSMLGELGGTAAVLAFVALLAAIAAPGFSGLFRKSAEGSIRGGVGVLRLAVDRFRREHGRAPDSLESLVDQGALAGIPELWPRFSGVPHEKTKEVRVVAGREPADTGAWAYVVAAGSPTLDGAVFIDCTHTDTKGSSWSAY